MTVVDPTNAGSKAYKEVLDRVEDEAECPFCETSPNFLASHSKPILFRSGHWLMTESSWPYENAEHQYLIILRTHKTDIAELTVFEWNGLFSAIASIPDLSGGGLAIRFGETRFTGATVTHLHAHVIIPKIDPDSGNGLPVYFPFGHKITPS